MTWGSIVILVLLMLFGYFGGNLIVPIFKKLTLKIMSKWKGGKQK
jgi:hypothetical protein